MTETEYDWTKEFVSVTIGGDIYSECIFCQRRLPWHDSEMMIGHSNLHRLVTYNKIWSPCSIDPIGLLSCILCGAIVENHVDATESHRNFHKKNMP